MNLDLVFSIICIYQIASVIVHLERVILVCSQPCELMKA